MCATLSAVYRKIPFLGNNIGCDCCFHFGNLCIGLQDPKFDFSGQVHGEDSHDGLRIHHISARGDIKIAVKLLDCADKALHLVNRIQIQLVGFHIHTSLFVKTACFKQLGMNFASAFTLPIQIRLGTILLYFAGFVQSIFIHDSFLAGIIIAAVSIPIFMGYAQIAGLPAVYGLYVSVFPIIVFALFSTSPQFIFGVDAAPAALIGGALLSFEIEAQSAEAMTVFGRVFYGHFDADTKTVWRHGGK